MSSRPYELASMLRRLIYLKKMLLYKMCTSNTSSVRQNMSFELNKHDAERLSPLYCTAEQEFQLLATF